MRIALCLHGYFGSLTDQASTGHHGYEHIKKHILSKRDEGHKVDIFIHSWQPELYDTICKMYNPVAGKFEKQIDFLKIAEEKKISKKYLDPYDQLGNRTLNTFGGSGYVGPERIMSHFYSIQEVFSLQDDWAKSYNIEYDWVIKARFDLGRINRRTSGPGKQNSYPCQCINFDPNLDNEKLYMAMWDLYNEGPPDMWFYSGPDNMYSFQYLYSEIVDNYLKLGSEYHMSVVTGWPESKLNDFRSNESLKEPEKRARDLHIYPPHMAVNTILLYKWFLMDHGLWGVAVPLETEWE